MITTHHASVEYHPSYFHFSASPSTRKAIDQFKAYQLDNLAFAVLTGAAKSIDDFREVVSEWTDCGSWAMHLSLEDRLELLETYAEDYGLEVDASLDGLRTSIEAQSSSLVCMLGAQEALAVVEEIEELLEELSLDVDSITERNPYEMFRHYGERIEGSWQVYEYRNVEEAIHEDVYEHPDCGLYVREPLDKGDLSEEEKTWNAS